MKILDLVARNRICTPTSVNEYFALQLARRFSDTENADWYRRIAGRYAITTLLGAYRQAVKVHGAGAAQRFRASIKN